MVSGYLRSKEGEREYSRLGLPYLDSVEDENYEAWKKDTSIEMLSKYSKHKPIEVLSIMRVKTCDGPEKIVYHAMEYRVDKALNVTHRFRPNIGIYPIPTGRFHVVFKDYGKQERVLDEVQSVETAYSIDFTPKNLDKIRDIGTALDGKMQYMVTTDGVKYRIQTYDDLRNGKFEELVHFGKIPN